MENINMSDIANSRFRNIIAKVSDFVGASLMMEEDFKKYVMEVPCCCYTSYGPDGLLKTEVCAKCELMEKYGWKEED